MSTSINALPVQGLTKLTTGQRLRSKLVTLDLTNTAGEKAGIAELDGVKDLARDIFHQLHQADPQYVDEPPLGRAVNRQLLDHAKQSSYWDATRRSTVGDMLTSMRSATIMHDTLLRDEAFQKALQQQEQASRNQRDASRAEAEAETCERLAPQLPESQEKEQLVEQAQAARERAKGLGELAKERIEQAQAAVGEAIGDGTTRSAGRIAAALKQASEEAQELADTLGGWGSGPGNELRQDPRAAMDYLNKIKGNPRLAEIAKLAGRFKGIAFSARSSRVAVGNTPFDATYTRDPLKIFPAELALLSKGAPEFLRARQAGALADRGLLGSDTRGEAKEAGPYVFLSDTSGSMYGRRDTIAKAVGLGLGQVAASEGRHYVLGIFSDDSHDGYAITDRESWQQHLDWAARSINGGTSFNKALAIGMRELIMLRVLHGDAIGEADLVIASDGEGLVSKEQHDHWEKWKEEHGTRLLYLCVSRFSYNGDGQSSFGLQDIADKTIMVDELDRETGDRLAAEIGTWIQ